MYCLGNTFNDTKACSFYRWMGWEPGAGPQPHPQTVLPQAHAPQAASEHATSPPTTTTAAAAMVAPSRDVCLGPKCAERDRPHPRHKMCINNSCLSCCQTTPVINGRTCPAARHNQAQSQSRPFHYTHPAPTSAVTVPAASPTSAHTPPVPVPSTTLHALFPVPSSTPATPAPAGATPFTTYGRMLSPTYRTKLQESEFLVQSSNQLAVQKAQYHKQTACVVHVKWWTKDGELPLDFQVPAPEAPYFVPQKSETIVSALGGKEKCASYSVFDRPRMTWVITSLPQKVKPNDLLCMRSLGVTDSSVGFPFTFPSSPSRSTNDAPATISATTTPTTADASGSGTRSPSKRPANRFSPPSTPTKRTRSLQPQPQSVIELSSDSDNEMEDLYKTPPPDPFRIRMATAAAKARTSSPNVDAAEPPPSPPPASQLSSVSSRSSTHIDAEAETSFSPPPMHDQGSDAQSQAFQAQSREPEPSSSNNPKLTLNDLKRIIRLYLHLDRLHAPPTKRAQALSLLLKHQVTVDWVQVQQAIRRGEGNTGTLPDNDSVESAVYGFVTQGKMRVPVSIDNQVDDQMSNASSKLTPISPSIDGDSDGNDQQHIRVQTGHEDHEDVPMHDAMDVDVDSGLPAAGAGVIVAVRAVGAAVPSIAATSEMLPVMCSFRITDIRKDAPRVVASEDQDQERGGDAAANSADTRPWERKVLIPPHEFILVEWPQAPHRVPCVTAFDVLEYLDQWAGDHMDGSLSIYFGSLVVPNAVSLLTSRRDDTRYSYGLGYGKFAVDVLPITYCAEDQAWVIVLQLADFNQSKDVHDGAGASGQVPVPVSETESSSPAAIAPSGLAVGTSQTTQPAKPNRTQKAGAKNTAINAWLYATYRSDTTIMDIRHHSNVKDQQQVATMRKWVKKVGEVVQRHNDYVIIDDTAGAAVGKKISLANIAALFNRKPQWLNHCTRACDLLQDPEVLESTDPTVVACLCGLEDSTVTFGASSFLNCLEGAKTNSSISSRKGKERASVLLPSTSA
ncbi:hypothetical protein FA95DRAFT_1609319 [Auriscalpium vulgare]|uniref:Uncharacterized protein n=1 Tax=Auriscalpium vulgare TaxID=40419 RepID=A0ACB8RHY5_9AGAM|nr:hypothetical protein FA95DRAFT_1609319 [Auriscalpium vulgare]